MPEPFDAPPPPRKIGDRGIDPVKPGDADALINQLQPGPQRKVGDLGTAPVKQLDDGTRNALLNEFALAQQIRKAERANPNAFDLGVEMIHSGVYSGIQSPITSLGQIADYAAAKADIKTNFAETLTKLPAPEHEDFGTARWHFQQIGGGAGMILPFMVTKGTLKATGLSFAARTETSVLASSKLVSTANAGLIADGATAGFAYDFFLRPVEQKDMSRFWTARAEHGLTGAATFGTLTAGSVGLRHATRSVAATVANSPKVGRIAYDFTMGAVPGIPAGIVSADVNARLKEGRWATGEERKQGAYTMFMAGGVLSAAHTLPGSEVPIGDVARAYAARKAGASNLEAMLSERARATEAAKPTEATGDSKLTGRGGSKTGAADLIRDARVLASTDKPVEGGVAKPMETVLEVPKGYKEVFDRGVDLAFKGSDLNCTPEQVADFFRFARGEGAPLRNQMMEVAKQYADDPRMMTLIREAYMPPEGVEHRVVQGDIKLKTPNATMEQFGRWKEFMDIVREMPQDVDGYVNFRHDVFRWLNENKDLHDWARQYGEQNRYSKIAGPLDYYFGTSNLGRFVEAADARALTATPGNKAAAAVAEPHIRIDLTAAEAHQGRLLDPAANTSGLSGIEALGIVAGSRTLADGRIVAPESAPRVVEPARTTPRATGELTMDQRMAAFEKGNPTRQKLDALPLAERFGEMTTEQFAKWLDYAYAKPSGATNDGATNLRSLWMSNRDVLLSPEVVEAYKQYRRIGEPPADGAPQAIPLEAIRQFLSQPKAVEAQPLPEWIKFYVDARVEMAQATAKPDAKPHEVLNDALPRSLVEGLRQEHTIEPRIAGQPPTYKSTLPPELAELLEAARLTQPPKPPRRDGRPEKEFKPPTNDANFRLGKLQEIMKVEDPIIRDNLLRLGSQDGNALRTILGKLDPERAAPEYQDLLRMVLPKAQNANEVKILLDSIFFGNKSQRENRDSEATKQNVQLAMAAAEHLVPQSDANFDVTQRLVSDFIFGKIRDPRPPRFGESPPEKGPFAGIPKQGPASPRLAAPPRPPQELVVKDVAPPAEKPPVAGEKPPVAGEQPPVAGEKPPVAGEQPPVAGEQPPVAGEKPPVAGEQPPVAGEKPPVAGAKPPVAGEKPPVAGEQPPVAFEKPPVAGEKPPGAGEKPPVAGEKPDATTGGGATVGRPARPADVSSLRNGQNIKIGDQKAVFVGQGKSGETIVRLLGDKTWVEEVFYNSKQYGKMLGKMNLQEVVTDKSADYRRQHIYRDGEGKFYEIHQHGSGYMVTEAPEYRVVQPGDITVR